MTEQQAMRMALEALEGCGVNYGYNGANQYFDEGEVDNAITALLQALEQELDNEPELTTESAYQRGYLDGMAKRPKALSDEQVHNLIDKERAKVFSDEQRVAYRVARAIEAAHNIWD